MPVDYFTHTDNNLFAPENIQSGLQQKKKGSEAL